MNSVLYILTGPTAVGKTAHAVEWAERHGAEIISCDSLLLYRGMDIGTAKPKAEECSRVPHHMIDIAGLDEGVTVKDYAERALRVARDIRQRGRKILVTGGSGFYLKAFYAPVSDSTPPDPALRKHIQSLQDEGGLAALQDRLRALHPAGWQVELDMLNPRRVAAALERCLSSGKTLDELKASFDRQPGLFADFGKITCLLTRSVESLDARIRARTRSMLAAGLIDEVRHLRDHHGLAEHTTASRAVGYRQVLQYLAGGLDRNELEDAINVATRQLAAKQRKWFRTQLDIDQMLNLDDEPGTGLLFSTAPNPA